MLPGGRGGTWNRDGTILFAPSNAGPLFRVLQGPSVVGRQWLRVKAATVFRSFFPMAGTSFLCAGGHRNNRPSISDRSTEENRASAGGMNRRSVGARRLLFVRQSALVAIPFDVEQGEIDGGSENGSRFSQC